MNGKGTIDVEGFRADLGSIAVNRYVPLQLCKLPFNWYAPAGSGIVQKVYNASSTVTITGVSAGSALVAFVCYPNRGHSNPQQNVTDSRGSTYTNPGWDTDPALYQGVQTSWTNGVTGGTYTLSSTGPQTTVAEFWVLEIAGVTAFNSNASGGLVGGTISLPLPPGAPPGDMALLCCSNNVGTGSWTDSAGWTVLANVGSTHLVTQTVGGAGTVSNSPTCTVGDVPVGAFLMTLTLSGATSKYTPAPVTSIPLNGPCNFFSLVSEAIDEQGNYQSSSVIGEQAAAGFVRFNGPGNVWIPVSFVDPLTPGFVTTSDNYQNTPIAGTGFSSFTAPFHQIDWQPASPYTYTGTPPSGPVGYLLAFAGLNVGVGAGIGSGTSSTHAIPSSAGPVARKKCAGLL